MVASNASLWSLITAAYQVQDYQISGGPTWLKSARFDINAKGTIKPDIPIGDQISQMSQALLADRFQLRLHREAKEIPIYALLDREETGRSSIPRAEGTASIPRPAFRPPRQMRGPAAVST